VKAGGKLQSWRWRRHAPPKHLLTFSGLHVVISQTIELFITTAVRCSLCSLERFVLIFVRFVILEVAKSTGRGTVIENYTPDLWTGLICRQGSVLLPSHIRVNITNTLNLYWDVKWVFDVQGQVHLWCGKRMHPREINFPSRCVRNHAEHLFWARIFSSSVRTLGTTGESLGEFSLNLILENFM
jgi:hypothetical protein